MEREVYVEEISRQSFTVVRIVRISLNSKNNIDIVRIVSAEEELNNQ